MEPFQIYLLFASHLPLGIVALIGIPSKSFIVKNVFNALGILFIINQIVSGIIYFYPKFSG